MAAHNYPPILVAEDEETDVFFLKFALGKSGLPNPLIIARDGQEAVDYLSGLPPFGDRARHPLPGLLLLDLKMPRLSGFDVLAWLATQPGLQHLPVVVLSRWLRHAKGAANGRARLSRQAARFSATRRAAPGTVGPVAD